ncbi:MAG: flagellar hook-length control protein FliK [Roseibium sp.]
MSVQTQGMVRGMSSAGKAIDAQPKGEGQECPIEAAAKFQSMMDGMGDDKSSRKLDTSKASRTDEGKQLADQTTNNPEGKEAENVSPSGNGSQSDFSTKNLTDAIRKVSQTVLAKTGEAGLKTHKASERASVQPDAEQTPIAAIIPSTLTLKTVLATSPLETPNGSGQMSANQNKAQLQTVLPSAQANGEPRAAKTGTSSLFAQFGIEPESISEGQTGRGGTVGAIPADAADTVKVVRQETHFVPNLRLSPAQQVGQQVSSALTELPTDLGRAQSGLTAKAEGPVLKTLDIQLTPHELGTVKVSLRMVGDTVEVQLTTSRAQTAELLKQDRQMLDQMLRTTGFNADTITILAADDRSTVQTSSQSGNTSALNQNANNSGAQFDGQRGNQNGADTAQSDSGSSEGSHEDHLQPTDISRGQDHEDGSDIRLSDGIYL